MGAVLQNLDGATLQTLLIQRGKWPVNLDPLSDQCAARLQDDGAGVYVAFWDVARCGAEPTQANIDAAFAAPAVLVDARADAEVGKAAVRATVEFILRRTIPTWGSMTGPQKQAARDVAKTEWVAIFKALQ